MKVAKVQPAFWMTPEQDADGKCRVDEQTQELEARLAREQQERQQREERDKRKRTRVRNEIGI